MGSGKGRGRCNILHTHPAGNRFPGLWGPVRFEFFYEFCQQLSQLPRILCAFAQERDSARGQFAHRDELIGLVTRRATLEKSSPTLEKVAVWG